MTEPKKHRRQLLDADGENLALRWFLALYGGSCGVTVKQMRQHLFACGFDGCWPEWVSENYDHHLTKSGAQHWIRHLIALEGRE